MKHTLSIFRFTLQKAKRWCNGSITHYSNSILVIALLCTSTFSFAQQQPSNLLPLPELLQYQASKAKQGTRWMPFRKHSMHRSRLPETLSPDSVQLWEYHTALQDSIYSPALSLCRQLKPTTQLAFAVIDHTTGSLQLVFWDKRIYRHYAEWLNRIGYILAQHRTTSNTLPFRKTGVSIGVDITIWADCYVMSVY